VSDSKGAALAALATCKLLCLPTHLPLLVLADFTIAAIGAAVAGCCCRLPLLLLLLLRVLPLTSPLVSLCYGLC